MKRILCCVLFCLFLFHVGQARANMVSGTVTVGSITAGGTSDQYFTGTSGQVVTLNSYSASYTAQIFVYNPDGTLLTSQYNRLNSAVAQTGTFHVVIKGLYSTDHGSYNLYYVIGGGSVSGGSLTSGGTIAD